MTDPGESELLWEMPPSSIRVRSGTRIHWSIDIAVGDFTNFGFDIFYRFTSKKDEKVVTFIKTGIIGFDYKTGRISKIPVEVISRIQALGTF